jgi:hypothetical protein
MSFLVSLLIQTTTTKLLNKHDVKSDMLAVFIAGEGGTGAGATHKYLGVIFDRSLCGNELISRIFVGARKGLLALNTMPSARMPQKIQVILFQAHFVSGGLGV